MALVTTLLYILFVLSAFVLIVVILLQEGKGGGFGQALGEHGQQTFGVGAKGINTFTGYTAAVFLVSALVLHAMNRTANAESIADKLVTVDSTLPPGMAPPAAQSPVPAGGGGAGGGASPAGGNGSGESGN